MVPVPYEVDFTRNVPGPLKVMEIAGIRGIFIRNAWVLKAVMEIVERPVIIIKNA